MRLNDNYTLRSLAGNHMLVNEGGSVVDMVGLMNINETAAWFWKKAEGREFELSDIAAWLLEEYDLGADEASEEAALIVASLRENGLLIA